MNLSSERKQAMLLVRDKVVLPPGGSVTVKARTQPFYLWVAAYLSWRDLTSTVSNRIIRGSICVWFIGAVKYHLALREGALCVSVLINLRTTVLTCGMWDERWHTCVQEGIWYSFARPLSLFPLRACCKEWINKASCIWKTEVEVARSILSAPQLHHLHPVQIEIV